VTAATVVLRNPPFWPTAIAMAMAGAWLFLGFNSQNVPWGSSSFWIGACSIAAGAAVAVARYRTLFALRSYCVIVVLIGIVRSSAYVVYSGTNGPAAVWVIVSLTTAIGYINVNRTIRNGGY
jgi:hypothetical protein